MGFSRNDHLFDSKEFHERFYTDVPLGVFLSEEGTVFRLWAPTAQSVTLRLYLRGDHCTVSEQFQMSLWKKGVWEYKTDRLLRGVYYDYMLIVDGESFCSADPYCRACGLNGERSMIPDPSETDPEGWGADTSPAKPDCDIIYELHVKDFSWDPNGGFFDRDRGRFSALKQEGTTLNHSGLYPTGLDYLKRLGITHVQILPMYDYGSVNEAEPEKGYNWGYDPVNYNVPEGSYSSDPYNGAVRIRELKEMILQLHRAGLRVIMDVVYNHTYDLESPLFKTAPWYFYRQNEDGSPSNGSGCGNDIASERSMCSRYILDSVLYWAEEYHIDGFRFDLMGLLDQELMEQIRRELDARYGMGEKLVYGEPWSAGPTAHRPGTILCHKGNLKQIHEGIGAFCDDTRDLVKGSVMDVDSVGFVNGNPIPAELLGKCLTAWTGEDGVFRNAGQSICYLSCHDDWTLWDKLVYTMDPKKDFCGSEAVILQANRLAAAIHFCCQGRLFLHAGEEFGRTKGGVKNSYCSSAEINQIDWTRAWKHEGLVDYYRGLIALRKQLPWTKDLSEQGKQRLLWVENETPFCALACVNNEGADSLWDNLLLIFNCGQTLVETKLPEGKWQILVDGESSFLWKEEHSISGSCSVPPKTAQVLGAKRRDLS